MWLLLNQEPSFVCQPVKLPCQNPFNHELTGLFLVKFTFCLPIVKGESLLAYPKFFFSDVFISSAHIGSGQIMGWGEKAIEVRSVETGLLDGVFMHKRAQTFRFLCERNEKVSWFT